MVPNQGDRQTLTRRLRHIMDDMGISKEDLRAKSGCGYGTIRRAITAEGNLTMKNLGRIAAALGVAKEALTIEDERLAAILLESARLSDGGKEAVINQARKERLWESKEVRKGGSSEDVAA